MDTMHVTYVYYMTGFKDIKPFSSPKAGNTLCFLKPRVTIYHRY